MNSPVQVRRQRVYEATLESTFVERAVAELKKSPRKLVRIHESGDFYSAAYVRKWISIVGCLPEIAFWAYTRSWRVRRILQALIELSKLPNMQLFWSTDIETVRVNGTPPYVPGVKVAYWKPEDGAEVPAGVDIVWKDRRGTTTPEPGLFACPQGIAKKKLSKETVRCGDCGWCAKRTPSRADLHLLCT